MPSELPNILILLSDEHCGMAMSHAGDPNVRTAAMDRLASEGVSFPRAYANCPICTPSRGTIFSGRHAHAGPVSGFFDVYKATAASTATISAGIRLSHSLLRQMALRHGPGSEFHPRHVPTVKKSGTILIARLSITGLASRIGMPSKEVGTINVHYYRNNGYRAHQAAGVRDGRTH